MFDSWRTKQSQITISWQLVGQMYLGEIYRKYIFLHKRITSLFVFGPSSVIWDWALSAVSLASRALDLPFLEPTAQQEVMADSLPKF